jgi:EAL domain-containing protein (putative c-di-GMP-specific phosphodiesterase class I)
MAKLLEAIRDNADPMTLMTRVVDQALVMIPAADGAAVQVAVADRLTCVCAGGTLENAVGTSVAAAGSLSGLALRTRQTLTSGDAASDPRVDSAATARFAIGSMACVPLWRGAEPVGVLTLSAATRDAFTEQSIQQLRWLAEFISAVIGAAADLARITESLLADEQGQPDNTGTASTFMANVLRPEMVADAEIQERIEGVLDDKTIDTVYQPVIDLRTGRLQGIEALSRFPGGDARPPDRWFTEAHVLGLGVELEALAIELILARTEGMPGRVPVGINCSPSAALDPHVQEMMTGADVPLVLEVTEHDQVSDYQALRSGLEPLRRAGIALAVDDTGAGYASLHHILHLSPDILKLDRGLTVGIDADPVRRALGAALVRFAVDIGAETVAEGIETDRNLDTVRSLGMDRGQGFVIGRPGSLEQITTRFGVG